MNWRKTAWANEQLKTNPIPNQLPNVFQQNGSALKYN